MPERITVNSKKPVSIKENLISHKRKTDFRSNSSPVNRILYLQRTIGNQAVQRMVRSGALQAKLSIGQPGDVYEQEADRVADAVMRMPEPGVQRQVEEEEVEEESIQTKPIADQITPLIQKQAEEEEEEEPIQTKLIYPESQILQRQEEEIEEEEILQTKKDSDHIPKVTPKLESHIQALRDGGQPLSESKRAFFEPRFGYDFSQVRMYTDTRAAEMAQVVNARAFTVGRDVVFGAGQYVPGSTEGRRLLAHELTHVIQQGGADSTIVPQEDSETGDSTLQKHETIVADETVGDISRQATPKLSSGLRLQRAACPCCTDSIGISNINQIDIPSRMGHSFDVLMGLSYPASGPPGSCELEWWEKTNVPYTRGMSPNTWTNMFALHPNSPTLAPWINRTESCATCAPVTINDTPSLGRRPGRTVERTLDFRIKINSMPKMSGPGGGCTAASKQITAKQVLKMVNGAPDWAASSFTTP